ncbi:WG repeat-containing protein [Muriicola sp. Z0-33]|uniref:WG repeat-containing protein n=1 Tax=Muriicola sp. Z0-33 TaxID=2816957 RepID=UPI002237D454|nr:WG repeat-containing protein [Muriicola sp. Z0-33]MCW5514758.1 WG repeat-containing protein [Muriicola sp. Z0-33]
MKRIYALLFVVLIALPFAGKTQVIESINKPILDELDEVRPFSEGLAAVRKGNQWGFINTEGKLVIDFRSDLVWSTEADTSKMDIRGIRYPEFLDGLCMNQALTDEGIPLYGFINSKGEQLIQPEFVNITQFENGKAIGIFAKKTFRGQNEIKLNVFDYSFIEVLINTQGEILWPIMERDHILMSTRRFELPLLRSKLLSDGLLASKNKSNEWEIHRLSL